MHLRQARVSDAATIAPLFDQYRQFYGRASDLAGARRFLEERLEKHESVVLVAAEDSGAFVGFAQLYPTFSSLSMRPLWVLNDLFVAPAGRGRGAGKRLVEACQDFAREAGARGLTLKTAVTNAAAQRLYESLGWARETDFYSYDLNFPT